jgi:hypothetical protein
MDRGFARFGPSGTVTPWPTKLTLKPSEYFRRQMYCTFIDDSFGVASRHWIGVDNVMWSFRLPPHRLHLAAFSRYYRTRL